MTIDDQAPAPQPLTPDVHPLRTAAIVIYGTFALLILAIPQSLVNRLNDLDESPPQQIVLRVAEAVQAASHSVGLDRAYLRARAAFLALAGKDEN